VYVLHSRWITLSNFMLIIYISLHSTTPRAQSPMVNDE
jgi:hypothetical protein